MSNMSTSKFIAGLVRRDYSSSLSKSPPTVMYNHLHARCKKGFSTIQLSDAMQYRKILGGEISDDFLMGYAYNGLDLADPGSAYYKTREQLASKGWSHVEDEASEEQRAGEKNRSRHFTCWETGVCKRPTFC